MPLIEREDNFVLASIPVNNGTVRLSDLRDLLEAVDALPDSAVALVMTDEIRIEDVR